MMIRRFNKKAAAVLEYTLLLVVFLSAVAVMNKYIFRGILGRWRSAGDSFGYGRQYDPSKTLECAFDPITSQWYAVGCWEVCIDACAPGNKACEAACPGACFTIDCASP